MVHKQPYKIEIKAKDDTDNESIVVERIFNFTVDFRASIRGKALTEDVTPTREVKLSIKAENAVQMQISNTDIFTDWQPFKEEVDWQLSEGYGKTRVYLKLRDDLNNESQLLTTSIIYNLDQYYKSTGIVLIPAGSFQMGDHHDNMSKALPVHTVELDAFYMDIHEVTVGQFRQFVNQNGYKI